MRYPLSNQHPPKSRPNKPLLATGISLIIADGEIRVVIDVREYASDPDDEIPRLLRLEPPGFGAVEQLDDYRVRYSAPSQKGVDTFFYRVVDGSNAQNESPVMVKVVDAQDQPATERTTLSIPGQVVREAAGTEGLRTEALPKIALGAAPKPEGEKVRRLEAGRKTEESQRKAEDEEA